MLFRSGVLGQLDRQHRSSPVQIGSSSWSQVSAGDGSVLATDINNLLFSWGLGVSGQVGDGSGLTRSSPVQISSITSDTDLINYGTTAGISNVFNNVSWIQVSSGIDFSVAIDNNGKLWSWGTNVAGQLGTNNTITTSSPSLVGNSSWVNVSAGASFVLAVRSDMAVFADRKSTRLNSSHT